MKYFLISFSLTLSFNLCVAQMDTVFVNAHEQLAFNVPNAKFLFENKRGKVYGLPLDNMPCLAPEIHSNMPVYNGTLERPWLRFDSQKIVPVPIPNPFKPTAWDKKEGIQFSRLK